MSLHHLLLSIRIRIRIRIPPSESVSTRQVQRRDTRLLHGLPHGDVHDFGGATVRGWARRYVRGPCQGCRDEVCSASCSAGLFDWVEVTSPHLLLWILPEGQFRAV